jgi:hypothetical protein
MFISFEKISEELKSKKYNNNIHSFINLLEYPKKYKVCVHMFVKKVN